MLGEPAGDELDVLAGMACSRELEFDELSIRSRMTRYDSVNPRGRR